jgi:hypothetical protein
VIVALLMQAAMALARPAYGQTVARVVLQCVVHGGRLEECKVVSEQPARRGAGRAALGMVGVAGLAFAHGRAEGSQVRVPMRFVLRAANHRLRIAPGGSIYPLTPNR